MSLSPLHATHTAANIEVVSIDGIDVPLLYAEANAECAAAKAAAGLADLTHLGTAVLEGPDARRFANGMFTNNIRDLEPGQVSRSAMCDDRGRVQGLIDVYCTGPDRFEVVLEGVSADWFEQRYALYIVFDDVELSVSDTTPWILSLQGPSAPEILASAGLPTPIPGHHTKTDSGIRVGAKDRTGLGGFDLLVPTALVEPTWTALLDAGATAMGHATMEDLRIRSGRAQWPADGTERSLIHELRLNQEVCNFNKGCYLGQEVINRVDVKGQVNKTLERLIFPKETPAIGLPVLLDGKAIGEISSVTHGPDNSVALAVLRKAAQNAQEIQIETSNGMVSGTIQRS
jgi:folate-binding protein YgfZ